ncbi:PREDICTED: lisH domain-containing protein ARMC9-like [Ceratosolen solmsi marchali]|uniref:LisH domain-containing protein ARMC9-like n=1 Tax=Ceratosolen solmsi marchali TaxID=326594 RepID=A0AAJ6YBH3_9HYME|nr:PREDICTED: lisH domain-containing protein ARMC9-like [Ceratosolen solmsi marchali]
MASQNCNKIMAEYLSGNWQKFFKIWNSSFPLDLKESIEYKIMTLKLRVHYAILPIRIVQLHQNINCVSNCSSKVSQILENFVDKYITISNEKEFDDEQDNIAVDNMKQLEYFIKSIDGQKLIMELKDSSFMTLFTLPNIVNPEEDESMSHIFSIDWLEQLTIEIEKFVQAFFQNESLLYKQQLQVFRHLLSTNVNKCRDVPVIRTLPLTSNNFSDNAIKHVNKFTKCKSKSISKDQIIYSAIKNNQIEDWAVHYANRTEDDNLSTNKSTQTLISAIETDSALMSEPCHISNVVTSSIVTADKPSINNDELNIIKLRLFNLHKHYQKLKFHFYKLHEDYLKINEIAEILTVSLENSVQGQPVHLDMILQACLKIFPNRVNRNTHSNSEVYTDNKNILNNISLFPKLLDYKKIKLHLKFGDIKIKLLLLQALRQKLTLNQPKQRDDIIHEYTNKDLLELQENSTTSINIMQQTTSRFLNTLASLSCGRIYLSSNPIALNTIIVYLDNCSNMANDPITLDMLLATLQKMSLRKQERNYMIEVNLVEWLIYHLNTENFKVRAYRLEYSCALLMNLSLHSSARSRASLIASLLVSTMITLLSTDCVSILPYINGALQNFLLNNEINKEAKKLHLTEILEYYCMESDEELRRNILHTLKIHKRECNESLSDDDEFPDEDDDIFNVLEKELDENDPLEVPVGELQGENLLDTCYSIPTFILQPKDHSTKKILNISTKPIVNYLSKQSRKVELNVSKIIDPSRTQFNDCKTETTKNSTTEEFNSFNKSMGISKGGIKFQDNEEAVFLAKPKIMRTPPSSGRKEIN